MQEQWTVEQGKVAGCDSAPRWGIWALATTFL